jgi:hypothetical protein
VTPREHARQGAATEGSLEQLGGTEDRRRSGISGWLRISGERRRLFGGPTVEWAK